MTGNNQSGFLDQALTPVTIRLTNALATDGGDVVTITSPSGAAAVPSSGAINGSNTFTFTPFLGWAQASYSFTVSAPGATSISVTGSAVPPDAGTIFTIVDLAHSPGDSQDPVAGTQSLNGQLGGFQITSDGSVWFADINQCVIRRLDPTGELSVVAGTPGGCGYTGDNAPALQATLSGPRSVAIDEVNQVLYIADTGNNVIRAVDISSPSGLISTFAGGGNAPSPGYGDSSVATSAQLKAYRITLGPNNLLVFPDYVSGRIRSVNTQTGIINNWMAIPSYPNSDCGVGLVNLAYAGLDGSGYSKVTFDGLGNAYISADFAGCDVGSCFAPCAEGGGVAAVVMMTPSGQIRSLVGANTTQSTDGTWSAIYSFGSSPFVAVDPAGNLYVSETPRNRITEMDSASGRMTILSGSSAGYSGDYAAYTDPSVLYDGQVDVAFDAQGNLYVSDQANYALREVWNVAQTTKRVSTLSVVSGNGASTVVDQAGAQMKTRLLYSDGTPLVGYSVNYNVVTPGGGIFATSSSTDSNGEAKVLNNAGLAVLDGGYEFQASFEDPYGNAVSGSPASFTLNATAPTAGQLFAIVNVDHSGGDTPVPPAVTSPSPNNAVMSNINQTAGFQQTSDGSIWFADIQNCVIRHLDTFGELSVVAGTPAVCGLSGDNGPPLQAKLSGPRDVAIDEVNQVLYIADTGNNLIRAVDISSPSGLITTFAGGGSAPSPGYGDSSVATSAQLKAYRIALGPNHLLVFPDYVSGRIRSVNTQTGIINNWMSIPTFPVSQCGVGMVNLAYAGVDGSGYSKVIFDAQGNAYIGANFAGCDVNACFAPCAEGGGVPAVVEYSTGGALTALVGSNQTWTCGNTTCNASFAPGTPAGTYYFAGDPFPALDSSGTLYLSETARNRVMYLDGTGKVQLYAGNGSAGYVGDYIDIGDPSVEFNGPVDIGFVSPNDRFLISDQSNTALRMVWQ